MEYIIALLLSLFICLTVYIIYYPKYFTIFSNFKEKFENIQLTKNTQDTETSSTVNVSTDKPNIWSIIAPNSDMTKNLNPLSINSLTSISNIMKKNNDTTSDNTQKSNFITSTENKNSDDVLYKSVLSDKNIKEQSLISLIPSAPSAPSVPSVPSVPSFSSISHPTTTQLETSIQSTPSVSSKYINKNIPQQLNTQQTTLPLNKETDKTIIENLINPSGYLTQNQIDNSLAKLSNFDLSSTLIPQIPILPIISNKIDNENYIETNISYDDMDLPEMPQKDYNYFTLSLFYNAKTLINNSLKWYNNNIDINSISLINDKNERSFFNFKSPIQTFEYGKVFNIKGANIANTQLSGPIALYFANNISKSYELNEFTTIFMLKLNDFKTNSTLFELIANTKVYDVDDNPTSIPQFFSINLIKNKKDTIDIEIVYGSSKYIIPNILKEVMFNSDLLLLSVSYNSKEINVTINNKYYSFKVEKNENIILGSLPAVINKYGEINCYIFAMSFYKKELTSNEIIAFQNYVLFYLSKIYTLIQKNKNFLNLIDKNNGECAVTKKQLQDTKELLNQCVRNSKGNNQTYTNFNNRYNMNKLDPIPYPSLL